ncbi:cilia- and flagella-associated protein 161-like [Parasteatoda tepidariorum]|uniref:cilia- and flagella-associated protein 161-like n=1 Tax=Parasteatoda tepidariorum TaxID=114398 RepID=UPI001C7258BA|nr:cilia- and flagella-associated protein 161-like [Parasteatoda tepidariorum]
MDYSIFFETSSDRRKRYVSEVHDYHNDAVLLGYWSDERARKEIETERLLQAFANEELPFQKLDRYASLLAKPVQLTRNLDGFLHHGDIIRLKWSHQNETLYLAALPQNIATDGTFDEPCWVTASADSRIMARNSVYIFRNSNFVPNHVPLTYGEMIIICTVDEAGHRLLNGEPKNFTAFAQKSGHMEVTFVKELSGRGLWRIFCTHKDDRLKTEGQFIPCNTDVIIHHVASGQNLAVERKTEIKTVLGYEREISVHSYINRCKTDDEPNIWRIEAPFIKPEDYGEPIKLTCNKKL